MKHEKRKSRILNLCNDLAAFVNVRALFIPWTLMSATFNKDGPGFHEVLTELRLLSLADGTIETMHTEILDERERRSPGLEPFELQTL